MQRIRFFSSPTFWVWFAGACLITMVILNAIYIIVFSDNIPSIRVREVVKGTAVSMAFFAILFVYAIHREAKQ